MSKNIVFINQATGYLTIDIVNAFCKNFDKVALITGSIRIQNTGLHSKVNISKIVKYDRGNAFRKGFSWILGTIQIFLLLKFKFRHYQRFYFTIPPTAYLISGNELQKKYSIVIYDLFPDTLSVFGIKPESLIYQWWVKQNHRIFPNAHRIYTLSNGMKTKILKYSNENDISVIPNWTAFSKYIPIPKDQNSIIHREGLSGKFIVQYSGNIGVTHNIETIIEVAGSLSDYQEIEFLIIGRGERTILIDKLINQKKLTNCRLIPFRKDEELYESLCVADIAVITLDDNNSNASVPSKVYNLMAAGLPVLAIASDESTIAEIINKHHIGKAFDKDNLQGMKEFILQLKSNDPVRAEYAKNSFESSLLYSSETAMEYVNVYNS